MNDPCIVRGLHSLGQGQRIRRSGSSRLGLSGEPFRQAASLEKFHRVIRPPVGFSHVVNLNDVRMVQHCDCLGFALEPCLLRGGGDGAVDHHLERDRSIELQMRGFIDDPHPPVTQDCVHFVTGDRRKLAVDEKLTLFGRGWWRCRIRRWKEGLQLRIDTTSLLPAFLNLPEQLRTIRTNFFWKLVRVEDFLNEFPNAPFVRHARHVALPIAESAGGRMASGIFGRSKRRLQVTQFCR